MTGPHVTMLVNPVAGRGRAVRVAADARRALVAAGLPVRVVRTSAVGVADVPGPPWPGQLADPGRAVLLCGGDGTVAAALPALMACAVPVGLLPAGTGNDFARALGVPADPAAALRAARDDLVTGAVRAIDLGWIDTAASATGPGRPSGQVGSGRRAGRPFATVLACGFDARVAARHHRSRLPSGPLAYPAAVLAELTALRPRTYRVSVDGVDHDVDAVLVAVGNTAAYGGGMRICPDAVPDDGLLDVTVVRAVSRSTLVRVFPRVYSGRHRDHPAVEMFRGRSVTVTERAAVGPADPVYADGEPIAPLPVACTVRPGAVAVIGSHRPR